MKKLLWIGTLFILLCHCKPDETTTELDETGNSVRTRITVPEGYAWVEEQENSFGKYLQDVKLLPVNSKILDYKGIPIRNQYEHVAVLDFDVGIKDLQQCADAVIRVRAEYLWSQKEYDKIGFHFTSGHYYAWNQYKEGFRPKVTQNNKVSFEKTASKDESYAAFRKYLDVIFMYAGTISLHQETKAVKRNSDIQAGDILITPGSPEHVVFVCGRAKDKSGNFLYLLAEGYTPAQSIHILTNASQKKTNPWYALSTASKSTHTDRYTFFRTDIRTYK